jgi:hypothetical protein
VLRDGVEGVSELIDSPVEVLGADRFLGLGTGDVLFIDSSHTIKTGGDVQFLFDQVIPRLAAGVVVHVHDIFLPWDYPPDWVFAGRAWNEQYLVRAFLTFNSAFRILLGVKWLEHYRSDLLAASVPAYPSRYEHSGGSLWIQRVTDANGGQAPPPVRRPAPAATFARRMDIGDLASNLHIHRERLDQARADLGDQIRWYPYDIIGNLIHIDRLLHGENRDLSRLAGGKPVADIGGADGDLAFALEKSGGWQVDLIDTRATNMNGLQAARTLKEHFGSSVQICDIDLDAQFHLPRERYGLVLLLGILYHLQNPFYVLRQLSQRADYCILSTRVARYAGAERTRVAELPMAYLVGPQETNNDATNYWMFTPAGLDRVVARAGWSVLESVSFGDTENSDPSTAEHDERAFMLLRTTSPG